MFQLPVAGGLSTEIAQREHAARYFRIRAALRAEAKRATAHGLDRAHEDADFGSLQDAKSVNLILF
jgi:hypothetical protein